jgi:hypothetical protein
MVQTAMAGLQTAATTLTTSALNAVTYNRTDGFGWSNDIFRAGMNGVLANTLSSMAASFTSGTLQAINSGMSLEKLEGFNNAYNKSDIMKLNSLAGALAGQGVNYAMGGDFTLNVFNLSMMTNKPYNSGLLELHLGRNGVSMSLGTGGANVSFDNLQAVLRGAQVWNVNNRVNGFIKSHDNFKDSITLRAQYGFGDNVQKGQLWDILNGDARIMTNPEGDFFAQTTIIDGQRVINLSGYQMGMSMEDQMRLAVILGHEAYRDGTVTNDNYLETRSTTYAHTEMALRMLMDGQNLTIDDNLLRDLIAYSYGSDFFNSYADNYYDSSADYWKLMRDGTLVNDNKGWLVDENGNPILNANGQQIGSTENAIETGLLNILFGGTSGVGYDEYSDEQVKIAQMLMINAGMKYDERIAGDIRSRYWTGNKKLPLNMQLVMRNVGSIIAAPVSERYSEQKSIENSSKSWLTVAKENVSAFFDYLGENIEKGINIVRGWFSGLKPKLHPDSSEMTLDNPLESLINTKGKVLVPNGNSLDFFRNIITEDIMKLYKAEAELDAAGKEYLNTFCANFVRDTIKRELGKDIYDSIFGGKIEDTNTMFESFKNNPNLERIPITDYDDLSTIQDLADNGILVLVVIKNNSGKGHIAFVGHSDMVYNTIYDPSSNKPEYEGMNLSSLPKHHLTVVQAGTYTGTTSIRYTTTGWNTDTIRKNLLKDNMYFYTVKGR